MNLFHHAMPLEACSYQEIKASPRMTRRWGDSDFMPGYAWLAERLGYWPLFLSVGDHPEALRMTGYQNQWARLTSRSIQGNTYRQKGEFPSTALFSFADLPGAEYTDYTAWHLPLSDPKATTEDEAREVVMPGRVKEEWLTQARRNPGSVQAHVASLDLRTAQRVWCRSSAAKQQLISLGFPQDIIQVKRLPVDPF